MTPLPISHVTLTTAVGAGMAAQVTALQQGRSGLTAQAFETCQLPCWTGQVAGLETPLTGDLSRYDCRNHRLSELALQQDGFLVAATALRARYGAARVGVFIGTSTAGVQQTELAYRARSSVDAALPDWFAYSETQNTYSVASYVQQRLQLTGVAVAISTACSSSAKVFASAARAIAAGQCDAAIVGGVDSLCLTTLHGFNALQLLSPEPCRPSDVRRSGISIGEAAGFAILDPHADAAYALLGYGESSDAHHMSAPEPSGRGAADAMRAALSRAGLAAQDVGYLHLHGTATAANDLAEDKGANAVFGRALPRSSTKGYFGHSLGAAGMVGAAVALIALEHSLLPASLNTETLDPAISGAVLLQARQQKLKAVMSNAFGFGGNNCSLLLGRAP